MTLKRLTVFLMRDITTPDEAIRTDKLPMTTDLSEISGLDGRFYYLTSRSSAPSWVREVNSIVITPINHVFSSSASGVLVIEESGAFFAITFGYGRSLLDPAKVQRQFGLKVALNRIDATQIRSMDTKTFEDMVVTKNTQTSRSSDIPNFGVDVSRDILRAVAGEPRDKSFARRLAGSDALVLALDLEVSDLRSKCSDLLSAYQDTAYKANFEWIDHLAVVEQPDTILTLDELLVTQLRVSDTSNTHMALPEPAAWEDIDVFKIAGTRGHEYEDLDLDEYLRVLDDGVPKLSADLLRGRSVSVRYTRSNEFNSVTNLYQTLISEQHLDGQLYALIEGRWFAISKSLVDEVDKFVDTVAAAGPPVDDGLPNETEPQFNARMAAAHSNDLLLLDARIKRPGGASSGIEFCDLMSTGGRLIHIKRKSRSSTLSHLFAQGSVSAATFVGDGTYRDELRSLVGGLIPSGEPNPWLDQIPDSSHIVDKSDFTVDYVVLMKGAKSGTDWLPFFSKLNLMQHGKQLQALGFAVTVSSREN